MRYLITSTTHPPFFTDFFEPENHFCEGMTVVDLFKSSYYDGHSWVEIKVDHL